MKDDKSVKKKIKKVLEEKDKGRGVSYKVIRKHVKGEKRFFDNALDELIDVGELRELKGERFKLAKKKKASQKEEGGGKTPLQKFLSTLETFASWVMTLIFILLFINAISSGKIVQTIVNLGLLLLWAPPMKRVIPGVGKGFWFKMFATFFITLVVGVWVTDKEAQIDVGETRRSGLVNYSKEKLGSVSERRLIDACEASGGKWVEFKDACADRCSQGDVCAQVITMSCYCGESKCWNGAYCQPN